MGFEAKSPVGSVWVTSMSRKSRPWRACNSTLTLDTTARVSSTTTPRSSAIFCGLRAATGGHEPTSCALGRAFHAKSNMANGSRRFNSRIPPSCPRHCGGRRCSPKIRGRCRQLQIPHFVRDDKGYGNGMGPTGQRIPRCDRDDKGYRVERKASCGTPGCVGTGYDLIADALLFL